MAITHVVYDYSIECLQDKQVSYTEMKPYFDKLDVELGKYLEKKPINTGVTLESFQTNPPSISILFTRQPHPSLLQTILRATEKVFQPILKES